MPHIRRAAANHENPPLPPFVKGGQGGFGSYILLKFF